MSSRVQLNKCLKSYVSQTSDYIRTVQDFVSISDSWEESRKNEIEIIKSIIKRDETDDSDVEDLECLTYFLEHVRIGLHEIQDFLDAMEKLAVTSVPVFDYKNLRSSDLKSVHSVILMAQILSPLLLLFKRNNEAFFQPELENMEVLQLQLEKYTEIISTICDTWRDGPLFNVSLNHPVVEVRSDQSEAAMKEMLFNINMVDKIRQDEDFRTMFLFQGQEQAFMTEFSKRESDMCMFLQQLEACADKLDEMNRGFHIAGIVNSSVGITSGVLSILGLIFAPSTAGASLALTATGLGLGVASGTSSLIASATKIGVDQTQANEAEKTFQEFVKDSNEIQCCLDDAVQQHFDDIDSGDIKTGAWMSVPAIRQFLKYASIPGLHRNVKAFRATGQLLAQAAAQAGGQAVGDGLSLAGKAGKALAKASPYLNIFFIGVDITNIVLHSKQLQDCETQTSKWIRARVALWRVQVDSWERTHDSLMRARWVLERNMEFLEKPFLESVTWPLL